MQTEIWSLVLLPFAIISLSRQVPIVTLWISPVREARSGRSCRQVACPKCNKRAFNQWDLLPHTVGIHTKNSIFYELHTDISPSALVLLSAGC